jgi:hypothetical protein
MILADRPVEDPVVFVGISTPYLFAFEACSLSFIHFRLYSLSTLFASVLDVVGWLSRALFGLGVAAFQRGFSSCMGA